MADAHHSGHRAPLVGDRGETRRPIRFAHLTRHEQAASVCTYNIKNLVVHILIATYLFMTYCAFAAHDLGEWEAMGVLGAMWGAGVSLMVLFRPAGSLRVERYAIALLWALQIAAGAPIVWLMFVWDDVLPAAFVYTVLMIMEEHNLFHGVSHEFCFDRSSKMHIAHVIFVVLGPMAGCLAATAIVLK